MSLCAANPNPTNPKAKPKGAPIPVASNIPDNPSISPVSATAPTSPTPPASPTAATSGSPATSTGFAAVGSGGESGSIAGFGAALATSATSAGALAPPALATCPPNTSVVSAAPGKSPAPVVTPEAPCSLNVIPVLVSAASSGSTSFTSGSVVLTITVSLSFLVVISAKYNSRSSLLIMLIIILFYNASTVAFNSLIASIKSPTKT